LAEILDNCFPDRTTDGLESVANMFIEPLLKFLRGGFDRMQQKGASYCIKHLIENFIEKEYTDLIDLSHQSIISTTTVS